MSIKIKNNLNNQLLFWFKLNKKPPVRVVFLVINNKRNSRAEAKRISLLTTNEIHKRERRKFIFYNEKSGG